MHLIRPKRVDITVKSKTLVTFYSAGEHDGNILKVSITANNNISMNVCTHAVSSKKRRTQQKVVEMILPEGKKAAVTKGVA